VSVTPSQQIRSFPGVDRSTFRERGYTIVKGLFSLDEIKRLRTVALEAVAELERDGLINADSGIEGEIRASSCDLLSIPSLRHVLLDERLLEVVRELLGGQPSYFGDSSLRVGKNGTRGWHRDNVDRRRWRGGADWHDPYPILRCGLYLQDQAAHSGGLALRPGSSQPNRRLPTLPKLVAAQAGDLVAWELRTVHSGEAVRPRGLPRMTLNPRLQTLLPESLRVPEQVQRIVMFMTFAIPGPHLDNLLAYYRTRDYMRNSWASSRFGPAVWEQADGAGLHLLAPTPEYGTPADLA
jgi:Phytanoyl-CoA dioxygenase (PhyH)